MDNKTDKYERVTNAYARLDGKYEGRRQRGKHGQTWEYYNITMDCTI